MGCKSRRLERCTACSRFAPPVGRKSPARRLAEYALTPRVTTQTAGFREFPTAQTPSEPRRTNHGLARPSALAARLMPSAVVGPVVRDGAAVSASIPPASTAAGHFVVGPVRRHGGSRPRRKTCRRGGGLTDPPPAPRSVSRSSTAAATPAARADAPRGGAALESAPGRVVAARRFRRRRGGARRRRRWKSPRPKLTEPPPIRPRDPRTSCSRWTTPPGSPRPSRTCEPESPAATASVCSTVLLAEGIRASQVRTVAPAESIPSAGRPPVTPFLLIRSVVVKTIAIRDLRPQQVHAREETLLTANNGRPIAVLLPVDAGTIDETIEVVHRARGLETLRAIRRESQSSGAARMTAADIDALVTRTRRSRPR